MSANEGNLAYDTERQYIGTVYAKGLLGATTAPGLSETVVSELEELVGSVLPKLPKLVSLLESPRVPLNVKEQVIDRAFAAGTSELRRFLKVVCLHGRFDCLRLITKTARTLLQERSGASEVSVTTAEPIGDERRRVIAASLAKKLGREVVVRWSVDPALLGGLVVRMGDTVFDGSIANELERVRKTAADRAVQTIRGALDRFAVEA